jgi:hypothetical protein
MESNIVDYGWRNVCRHVAARALYLIATFVAAGVGAGVGVRAALFILRW